MTRILLVSGVQHPNTCPSNVSDQVQAELQARLSSITRSREVRRTGHVVSDSERGYDFLTAGCWQVGGVSNMLLLGNQRISRATAF